MPIELPLKPKHLHPVSKKQKSTGSGSGTTGGKKHRVTNGPLALIRAEQVKTDRELTKDNKRILVILPSGKRRFMLLSEYETR